jgi:glycosyltransferase involved in cell wall biosynthesis
LFNLIKQNDVLICPSWSEGMPNVILESMANGLTTIATDVGSTHLLVNSKTGWLIQNVDANEIYKTICLVLSTSAEEINQKKQSALQLIKDNFVWETLIKKLLQQLNDLK